MSKKDPCISDPFEAEGFWWLASSPDKKISGRFEYAPDGESRLALNGTLQEPSGTTTLPPRVTILGATQNGRQVSLLDCWNTSTNISSSGYSCESYFVGRCAIGNLVNTDHSTWLFPECKLRFEGLDEWMQFSPFKQDFSCHSKDSKKWADIEAFFAEKVEVHSAALGGTLSFEGNTQTNPSLCHLHLSYNTWLHITPDSPKKMEWYFSSIFKLQKLFALLIGRPVRLLNMDLLEDKQKHKGLDVEIPYYATLLFHQSIENADKNLHPAKIPFSLKVVQSNLAQLIENWFANDQKQKTVTSLSFGVSSVSMPEELRFIAVMQAFEAYCHSRQDLKNKGQKERLEQLIVELPCNLQQRILGSYFGEKDFAKAVIDTRDYFAHREEKANRAVLSNRDRFNVTMDLVLLLEFIQLREAGLDPSLVSKVMCTHWSYSQRPRAMGDIEDE